jgi:UPF0716 protein FxsA
MFKLLFVFFVVIPIIEIGVLIQIGSWLGFWPTIALVIFTAWLGAIKVREQGLATLQAVQNKLAIGEMPSDEIITGLCLIIAGVLLVTPGFMTDILGLGLLLPQCRQWLITVMKQQFVKMQANSSTSFHYHYQQQSFTTDDEIITEKFEHIHQEKPSGNTIDGEFERKN